MQHSRINRLIQGEVTANITNLCVLNYIVGFNRNDASGNVSQVYDSGRTMPARDIFGSLCTININFFSYLIPFSFTSWESSGCKGTAESCTGSAINDVLDGDFTGASPKHMLTQQATFTAGIKRTTHRR